MVTVTSAKRKKTRRRKDPDYSNYWQEVVKDENEFFRFTTAFTAYVEDASQITLQLYLITGHGIQHNIIGQFYSYIQRVTSNTRNNLIYKLARNIYKQEAKISQLLQV